MNLPLRSDQRQSLSRYKRAAEAGQGKAAYALCQYYAFVKFDEKRSAFGSKGPLNLNYTRADKLGEHFN